jgi:NADH:ubiquinone oxidoreductase subunit 3 (subunit A)
MNAIQSLFTRLIADPFVASRVIWNTSNTKRVQSQIANDCRPISANHEWKYVSVDDENAYWRGTYKKGSLTYFVTLTDNDRVHVTRELPGWVRFVLFAGLVLSPILIFTTPLMTAVLAVCTITVVQGARVNREVPSESCESIVDQVTHPLLKSVYLIIVFAIPVAFLQYIPVVSIALPLAGLSAVLLAMRWYVGYKTLSRTVDSNRSDSGEHGINNSDEQAYANELLFSIPLRVAWYFSQTVCIFFSTMLLAGAVYSSPEKIPDGLSKTLNIIAICLVFISILLLLVSIRSSTNTRRNLTKSQLQPFNSTLQKLSAGFSLIALNFILVVIATAGLAVVAYGVTGELYFPAFLFGNVVSFLPSELQVSTQNMIYGFYEMFHNVVSGFPIIPPRMLSTLLIALLLWPVFIIFFATVAELFHRPYRAFRNLSRSTPLTDEEGQDLLPPDIQIRRFDNDGEPDARPMTLLGGWRKYVFVSDVLVTDEAFVADDRKRLAAILRHEEYHIREDNQSFLIECLSLFVGGKNSLLAFYDYRESERNADDYAAEQTSELTTWQALDSMYDLKAEAAETDNPIGTRRPGIVQREQVTKTLEQVDDDISNLVSKVIINLRAAYDLYFGSVLLETAYLDPDERLDRLSDE